MPIYEYQCKSCSHQLEALQKVSEAALTDCPICHQPALSKLVSATSFQLKGTGWYATDFRNKGTKESPAASAAEQKTDSTTSSSGESSSTASTSTDSGQKSDGKSGGGGSSSTDSSSNTAAA